MKNLAILLSSSRVLMLSASLATRGAGFFTSLLIARMLGVNALGAYSALVNTASSVSTPFAQVLTNNSTILGITHSEKSDEFINCARASFALAFLLAAFSAVILVLLYTFSINDDTSHSSTLIIIGICAVFAQMLGAVSLGFMYGAGEFSFASRVTIAIALLACLAAYPVIEFIGLNGALALMLFTSMAPSLLLGIKVLRIRHKTTGAANASTTAWPIVRAHFFQAWPSVLVTAVDNAVNWLCTIYLVHSFYGTTGLGVFAVATQWVNLMMIPITSWSGVTLRTISSAFTSEDEKQIWRTMTNLIYKNLLVTLVLSGAIVMASGLIANAYHMGDTEVALLIGLNAVCALVASINNVFQCVFLAMNRQGAWLTLSLLGFSVQTIVTGIFISKGIWIVTLGVIAANLILCISSYFSIANAIPYFVAKRR